MTWTHLQNLKRMTRVFLVVSSFEIDREIASESMSKALGFCPCSHLSIIIQIPFQLLSTTERDSDPIFLQLIHSRVPLHSEQRFYN